MTRKIVAAASALTVTTMLGVSLVVGASLSPEVQLPIHWGLNASRTALLANGPRCSCLRS
jgi:hypothetical protein